MTEAAGDGPNWIENRPRRQRLVLLEPGELWAYRGLAFALAIRDLKLR